MADIKLGSLFDGIGVFPLAASRCGIVPVWASEIEKAPVSVTMRRFPEMEHLGDMTPAAWNAGVFSMIRQLSETVILPIAGLVLTFVMTYDRDLPDDQPCPYPLRHYRQPGGRAYGAQLFQVPFRRRVPGDAYHGLHGDLRRSGAGYRGGRRHDGGHLDLRGVHGAVVFRFLQDREPLEIHMGRSLKYCCKICC